MQTKLSYRAISLLWDMGCALSIVGIWPRFIEPNLLSTSHLNLKIPKLPTALHNLRLVQFSDLHMHAHMSDNFLKRLTRRIRALQPDLLLFTGDFLCYSQMSAADAARLLHFLNQLEARLGCYAIFGNHDYDTYVSLDPLTKEFDIGPQPLRPFPIKILRKLLRRNQSKAKAVSWKNSVATIKAHQPLIALLRRTPFIALDNETHLIKVSNSYLNICGLGDYWAGQFNPTKAFQNYDPAYPGIILSHNPDTVPQLASYPGDLVLSGHTHGGQVVFPGAWKLFNRMEHPEYRRGLLTCGSKKVYVNRGVAGHDGFRFLSRPEITSITLVSE